MTSPLLRRRRLALTMLLYGLRRLYRAIRRPLLRRRVYKPELPQGASSKWAADGGIHYLEFSGADDGPVVVCVHGVGGSHVTWMPLARRLAAAGCRVLVPDLPGHGVSPPGRRRAVLRHNRTLIEQFVRQVAGGPVLLVGHSMGGLLGLLLAASRTDLLTGLVLIDPVLAARRTSDPSWLVSDVFRRYVRAVAAERYAIGPRATLARMRVIERQLAFSCHDPRVIMGDTLEAYLAVAKHRRGQEGLARAFLQASFSTMWASARRRRITAAIERVKMPVLVIHGQHDRLVPLTAATVVAEQHQNWVLEVARDSGHVPMLEQPDWTAALITDWFSRNPGIRAPDGAAARFR